MENDMPLDLCVRLKKEPLVEEDVNYLSLQQPCDIAADFNEVNSDSYEGNLIICNSSSPDNKPKRSIPFKTRCEKEYRCPHCQKRFSYISNLDKHLLVHAKEKKFICENCGMKFLKLCSLQKHKWKVCSEKNKKLSHTCNECDMVFDQYVHLKSHIQYHDMDKRAKCNQCVKTKNGVTSMNIVTAKNKLCCGQCGRKVIKVINDGSESDSGSKCNVCEKVFIHETNLKRHMFTKHAQMKDEINEKGEFCPCPECGKMFTKVFSLNRHLRICHTKFTEVAASPIRQQDHST